MRLGIAIIVASAAAILELSAWYSQPAWTGTVLHGIAVFLAILSVTVLVCRADGALARTARALALRIGHGFGRIESHPMVLWLVAAKCDFEHWLWKQRHPGKPYAEFYAWQITRKLDRGGTHKTLGRRAFLPSGGASTGEVHDAASFATVGLKQFRRIHAAGLKPDDVVVDFGCGSLRVGQHLMRYLAPGNYWGLDVTDRFYRDGVANIGTQEIARCRPNLRVIGEEGLADAQAARPSLVVSIAVLKHIPASERAEYFDRLVALAGNTGRILISFTASPVSKRILGKSWSFRPADVIREIERRRPGARFELVGLEGGVPEIEERGTKVILTAVWPATRETQPAGAARTESTVAA